LAEILAYIDERNPPAADALMWQILDAVEQLPHHPFLYRAGKVPATREIVVHPNYIVVYQMTSTDIQILSVIHARQQYP
jgi:plasmid stabilization system protein ParE